MSAPNATLYLKNLNDQVQKDELRAQLHALFTTYGKIIDVVASKSAKMRGQAFLVFADLAGATTAMRACEGMMFYDKPMHIEYAKTKSYATLQKEDPNFVHPSLSKNPPAASSLANGLSVEKRTREDDDVETEPDRKRGKYENEEEMDEMDIEEEDGRPPGDANGHAVVKHPTAALLCTNLPQEVTDDVLSVLFQQYQGFQSTHVAQSPAPGPNGRAKMAQVAFDSPDLASVAKEALDGFTLKKGWAMTVQYV
ncbi:RNA-binding domain-containing protein [Gautieria morchelliformis]|nr:RNA-binding domain-containing protein [Gautieria morchelliformis]